jgi:hypothetical protein
MTCLYSHSRRIRSLGLSPSSDGKLLPAPLPSSLQDLLAGLAAGPLAKPVRALAFPIVRLVRSFQTKSPLKYTSTRGILSPNPLNCQEILGRSAPIFAGSQPPKKSLPPALLHANMPLRGLSAPLVDNFQPVGASCGHPRSRSE